MQAGIPGAVDDAHPPFAEFIVNAVLRNSSPDHVHPVRVIIACEPAKSAKFQPSEAQLTFRLPPDSILHAVVI